MTKNKLESLRTKVRSANRDWRKFHQNKGPCGAIVMALWLLGLADGIRWCETSVKGDEARLWRSHWIALSGSQIIDVSGVYLDHGIEADYRSVDWGRIHVWPDDYTPEDVYFWYMVLG